MKAREVLKLYAAGKRDFRGVNLRGQSFKGANLSGADFSGADIRSTNFSGANLRGAKFCGTKAGLQRKLVIAYLIIFLILTLLIGYISSVAGQWSTWFLLPTYLEQSPLPGFTILILIVIILCISISQNLPTRTLIKILISVLLVVFMTVSEDFWEITEDYGEFWTFVIQEGFGSIPGILAISILIEIGIGLIINITDTISRKLVSLFLGLIVILATLSGTLIWAEERGWIQSHTLLPLTMSFLVSELVVGLAIYFSWRAMKGDKREAWISKTSINLSAIGGTNFRDANLTEANFTGAKLKSTDFRKANLTRVCWYGAKMLDRVPPGNTYLKNPQLRQWLIGKGKNKSFDLQDLRGINLQGEKNLTDASFIGADLPILVKKKI